MSYSSHYKKYCEKNNINIDYKFINWIDKIENIVLTKTNFHLLDIQDEDMTFYEQNMSSNNVANYVIYQIQQSCLNIF